MSLAPSRLGPTTVNNSHSGQDRPRKNPSQLVKQQYLSFHSASSLVASMRSRPPSYAASMRPFNDQTTLTDPQPVNGPGHIQTSEVLAPLKAISGPGSANFYINLYQPNNYKAGDIVSGTVQLASKELRGQDIRVGSISISFSGHCTTTRLRHGSSHRCRTIKIFTEKQLLFAGPAKMHIPGRSDRGGVCPTFPFHFTFPSDCSQVEINGFEGGPFFNQNHLQPLPPSFEDQGQADKAWVTYGLKPELLAPIFNGYYTQGSFFQKLILNVYAPRTVEAPFARFSRHSKTFFHQSLDLLPPAERGFHKRPMTLRQKLGLTSMTRDRLPKTSFTATVLVPSVAVIGQSLPLMLHVEHHAQESTVTSPPVIRLKKLQVFLRAETSICETKHRAVKSELDQTGWTTSVQVAGMDFVRLIPWVEQLDLRKVMDLALNADLPPTFKTFNIARTYSLKVAGTIECAGKTFAIWSAAYTRCILLSKDYKPTLPEYDIPPPFPVDGENRHSTSEVLPPYHRDARNSQLVALPRYLSPRQSVALDSSRSHRSSRISITFGNTILAV